MKKYLLSFLTAIILGSFIPALAGEDVSFTVYIDNPDYVKVQVNWSTVEIQKGINKFTMDEYSNFSIDPKSSTEHMINHVYVNGEDKGSSLYISQYDLKNVLSGATVIVESCTIESARTGVYYLTIDNISRVSYISTDGYPSSYPAYKNGEDGVEAAYNYIPGVNTKLNLSANGAPLYQVKKDGEICSVDQWGSYSVELSDGCHIEIIANYPEGLESVVKFSFLNDGGNLFESLAYYADATSNAVRNPVEIVDSVAVVPMGSFLEMTLEKQYKSYKLNSALVYGSNNSTYLSNREIKFYAAKDTVNVVIDATRTAAVPVVINVNKAEGVKIQRGDYQNFVELVDGVNNVELSENDKDLTIKTTAKYKFTTATLNGEDIYESWDGSRRLYGYEIEANDVINLVVEEKPVFNVGITLNPAFVTLGRNVDYNFVAMEGVVEGYNEIECTEGYSKFELKPVTTAKVDSVMLNGEVKIASNYDGSYSFELEDGDEVVVIAHERVYDGEYVLYVDNLKAKNLSSFYWYQRDGKDQIKDVAAGYNQYAYSDDDNTFKVTAYQEYGKEFAATCYINDVKQPRGGYTGGTSWDFENLSLKAGDVVKVFLTTSAPDTLSVKFSDVSNPNALVANTVSFKNVKKDVITAIESVADTTFNVLQGTVFDFALENTATEPVNISVAVDGEELTADEDGVYHVTVTANTEIKLDYDMVPWAELYLVGEFNNWALDKPMTTDNGKDYKVEVPELAGQFKLVDAEWDAFEVGSNGSEIVLSETYAPINGSHTNIRLADQGATDVTVEYNIEENKLTINGTAAVINIAVENNDAPVFYTLQGVKLQGEPTAAGFYIRVAAGKATKIAIQ